MFEASPPRSRTPRTVGAIVAVLFLLAVGLWFGGHPSWLPGPLRSAFVSESSSQKLQNQVFGLLTRDYYRPVSRAQLVDKGLVASVASLDDPYSHYYDPSDYKSLQNNTTDPHIQGIGISPASEPDGVRVVEVYPSTPAAKAGLQTGDLITRAGNTSLADRSLKFSSAVIRGRAGTSIALAVRHDGRTRTVRVTRAAIAVPVAAGRLLHYHGVPIGYVDLAMFSEGAGDEVRNQVDRLRHRGAKAIILDLRGNGGGLLQEAVATASIFILDGTIVSTDGRSQPREVYMAKGDAIPSSVPLVDLVNRDTASSSEIVTGALRDRGRATIVGTRTYGKGVFQEIQPLRNGGALDFTVGEYFTPDGQNLGGGGVKRGQGIKPQVYVTNPSGAALLGPHDRQLAVGERVVTAKLR